MISWRQVLETFLLWEKKRRAEERTQSYNPCLVGRFFTEKMV
jgi:hypothetical protein